MTSTQLDIQVTEAAGECTMHVAGEVDIATAPRLEQEIERCRASCASLTIDLDGLTFIDSTGLAVLLRARRAAKADNGRLELARIPPVAHRLFELTGVEDYLSGGGG